MTWDRNVLGLSVTSPQKSLQELGEGKGDPGGEEPNNMVWPSQGPGWGRSETKPSFPRMEEGQKKRVRRACQGNKEREIGSLQHFQALPIKIRQIKVFPDPCA